MSESLKNKTFKSTIWSFIERFSVHGIQFLVMIIMARMLTPDDYGLVGMLAIFIAISQSLIDSGFTQALIRKQDRSEVDNSTVFYFNIGVGSILYLILFFCAPIIARFYNEPLLVPITRIIGLSIIFNSLAVVQRALLTLNLDFKTQAKSSLIGALVSGTIGIYMAYCGLGVWSIVYQQILNLAIVTTLLWILSKWKPIWAYSWESFKVLFNFGSKLLVSGLIDTIYRNIYLIVIGKIFNAADLGYYTRAQQFSDFASSNMTGIFQRVTYPVLCTIQNDDTRLSNVYRRMLRVAGFVFFPLLLGLAALAKPITIFFLTEKWLFSATLLVPLCLAGMWYPIHSINLNLLQVKGRSDLFLKLEIIKKVIGVIIICLTIPFGLIVMCWGAVLISFISFVINTYYTGKLISFGFIVQMKDLLPSLLLSFTMATIVYFTIENIILSPPLSLFIGILEGIFCYLTLAKVLNLKEFNEIHNLLKNK